MATVDKNKKYYHMAYSQVNRRVNPYLMKDDELWDSVNWWSERRIGSKKVRPGYNAFLNAVDANPVLGLFYVKFPDGVKRLIRISGKNIYAVDPNTAANWGAAKHSISPSNFFRPDYTVLNGKIHIVTQPSSLESHYIEGTSGDSYTEPDYVSGTDPVLPYRGLTCAMYHRRVYTGSGYDSGGLYGSYINWSAIDYQNKGTSPSSPWTSQATLTDVTFAFNTPVDKDYAGSVIKLTNINDRLMIYKEEGIYKWNETSLLDVFGLSPIQGTIATMKETKTDYFLTNEGFFKTDGQTITPVGEGWYDHIKQMFQNTLDPTQFHSFSANYLYFCYLGSVTYDGKTLSNACFVYNAYYNEMYLFNFGHHLTCFGYYINSSKEKVIVAGDVNGNTYQFDFSPSTNDDAGVPIKASMKTKYYYWDSPEKKNNITKFWSFASRQSEIEVNVDKDFKGEFKDNILSLTDKFSKGMKDPSEIGQFNVLSFEYLWNGKGERPEIYGDIPSIVQEGERINEDGK